MDILNNEENNKITQNETRINWNKLNDAIEYTIYIFNSKNEEVKYIQNICYLDFIKKKH